MKVIHIVAGMLALMSGAVALYAKKGSPLHRRSGMVFVASMLVMTSSAVVMATFFSPNRVNAVAGTLTFYLVSTGLLTVRRSVAQTRGLLTVFMLIALAGSAYAFALAYEAMQGNGIIDQVPAPPLIMFGVFGLVGALLDARILWVGSIGGAHRLARHLWRMTFAMWIATASFFLGQAKFFPAPIRKSGVLAIPVLIVLLMLIYWLARVLIKRRNAIACAEGTLPAK